MGVARGGSVFVSYRREDVGDAAGRLADRLVDRFGSERVFMDVDAIEPGMDYVEAIVRAVEACDVLVAVIGPGWLPAADRRGWRRLDDPSDWVRVEVGTALARDVRVIPVLVGNAVMPTKGELPNDIAGLARRNALRIRHESFRADAGQLVALIERMLASAIPAAPGGQSSPLAREGLGRGTAPNFTATRDNVVRAVYFLVEAERVACSITRDELTKALALSSVAAAVAVTDPGRAALLLGDAEHTATSIKDIFSSTSALSSVAEAAAFDPDRAERIANSIPSGPFAGPGLGDVAAAVAAFDPDRAERIANSITGNMRELALGKVAVAVAAFDPDRAERIAKSIINASDAASALSGVAKAVAATDPQRASWLLSNAEHIANSITEAWLKASALSSVAKAVAANDPSRAVWLLGDAERIANSVTDEFPKASALNNVATAVAAVDPGRAERIANSVTIQAMKELTLSQVAEAVAAFDPDRAESIANSITEENPRGSALGSVAAAVAAFDPSRAERIANSIPTELAKARALARIARALVSA